MRVLLTELILHGHDDFHVVQGIKTKVVDKVRLKCHLETHHIYVNEIR